MPVEISGQELQKVGDYDLVEKIAEGGMGTVFKGRHSVTGEFVAIKVVPTQFASNPVLLRRFEKEYNAAKSLDHPNIVRALEFGRTGEMPYLVMEFVEGESLGQRLERDRRVPEAEAIRIISQLAQGLHKAHKIGLIHRDVKPDNILLTPDGQVKLTDLGLVKDVESDLNLTRTGRGLGTPHFMAPEQFRRAKDADARCDIYSMAATLYQMLTGEMPFNACGPLDAWMKKINNEIAPPRTLAPDISERVDWAIRRSMSADPAQRPANCREFVEDLTGQSTRKIPGSAAPEDKELWFLVYTDDEAVVHTVKGSTAGVRRSLREDLLGDASNIRVSRSKEGPFEPLRERPEFRDLLIGPAALPPANAYRPPAAPVPPPAPVAAFSAPRIAAETVPSLDSIPTLTSPRPAKTPHIPIIAVDPAPEWLKWAVLIFLASTAGIAGYFLMPFLKSLRLF